MKYFLCIPGLGNMTLTGWWVYPVTKQNKSEERDYKNQPNDDPGGCGIRSHAFSSIFHTPIRMSCRSHEMVLIQSVFARTSIPPSCRPPLACHHPSSPLHHPLAPKPSLLIFRPPREYPLAPPHVCPWSVHRDC